MKIIRYKAKAKDNGRTVYGYYWRETNNTCFEEGLIINHYIREQMYFDDWGLYAIVDHLIDPSTLEVDREEEVF